jgi:hypothetical protein
MRPSEGSPNGCDLQWRCIEGLPVTGNIAPSPTSSPEPEFLVISWGAKPEVTSGLFRILPMLQLFLTRTCQNKPELCSQGLVHVLCGVRWGWGARVW